MALLRTASIHSLLQIPLIKEGKIGEPVKILLILFSPTFSIRSLFPQNSNQMARMILWLVWEYAMAHPIWGLAHGLFKYHNHL